MFERLVFTPVFKGLQPEALQLLMDDTHYQLRSYEKGVHVVAAGDICSGLYLLVSGVTRGEMTDPSGKSITIEEHHSPALLAPAFIFGEENHFPVDVVVLQEAKIMIIQRPDFIRMMQRNSKVLENYLNLISNRAHFLSQKIRFLTLKSLKSRIAEYIMDIAGDKLKIVELDKGQQELADYFGVARPSFARALSEMEAQGLIRYKNRFIEIIDKEKLAREIT
jgi:CRP/FNR family transcriptional regulator, dissimilatory nitrate respiration regulator